MSVPDRKHSIVSERPSTGTADSLRALSPPHDRTFEIGSYSYQKGTSYWSVTTCIDQYWMKTAMSWHSSRVLFFGSTEMIVSATIRTIGVRFRIFLRQDRL